MLCGAASTYLPLQFNFKRILAQNVQYKGGGGEALFTLSSQLIGKINSTHRLMADQKYSNNKNNKSKILKTWYSFVKTQPGFIKVYFTT